MRQPLDTDVQEDVGDEFEKSVTSKISFEESLGYPRIELLDSCVRFLATILRGNISENHVN